MTSDDRLDEATGAGEGRAHAPNARHHRCRALNRTSILRVELALSRERFGLGVLLKKRDRLELVIASPAVPQIGGTTGTAFDPLRRRYRLAALGAGISLGQIVEF